MNMLNRQLLLGAGVTVIALAVACQTAPTRTPSRSLAAPTNQPTVAAAAADTIEAQGVFTAASQATLTFKGSGRLTEVHVQEGAQVKRGDSLAELDKTELQLAVQQAQAGLDAATANLNKVKAGPTRDDVSIAKSVLDRAQAALNQAQAAYDRIGGASNPSIEMTPQSLALQQAYSQYQAALATYNQTVNHPTATELETAQAQVAQAQAALALAQQQVTNATLAAPFDGTVLSLGAHVGETVGPTTEILTLADLSQLQMKLGVDQDMLEQIHIGQMVTIVPDAFKDKAVTGKVSQVGWLATTTAGVTNIPVTIDVDPSAVPLRPGLTATVEFEVGK
jgi:multidrug resistance efflux pump